MRKLVALEKYEDALNGDTDDILAGDSGEETEDGEPKRRVNFRVRSGAPDDRPCSGIVLHMASPRLCLWAQDMQRSCSSVVPCNPLPARPGLPPPRAAAARSLPSHAAALHQAGRALGAGSMPRARRGACVCMQRPCIAPAARRAPDPRPRARRRA